MYIQYTCNLQVRVSTIGIVMHYTGWDCQFPNHQEIQCCNGNFVFDLHDFDLCTIFQEHIPGIKQDLPVLCSFAWCSFLLILSLRSKFLPHYCVLSSCMCLNVSGFRWDWKWNSVGLVIVVMELSLLTEVSFVLQSFICTNLCTCF